MEAKMSLDSLNEEQKEAVIHHVGPMMVLAGPGSGKTMVITHRIKYLLDHYNVNPKEVLVITFTKAAAEEMKYRFIDLNNNGNIRGITFGTFHSVFFRILRSIIPYGVDNIIKEELKYQVIKGIINELGIDYEDEQEFINDYLNELSLMKNELIDLKYYNSINISADEFKLITNLYEEYKNKNELIDFDDMLFNCYKLLSTNEDILSFWQKKYKYILIDEFQDINRAQYEVIKMLSEKHKNIFIVGDDDQSIYRFRGARPEFLLGFPNDFEGVKKVILNINYRSNEKIIKSSSRVINKNCKRYKKELISFKGQGSEPIVIQFEDSEQEAINIAKKLKEYNDQGLPYDEMAVIFRTNIQARALVDIFLDHNIPFVLRDQVPSIYEHWIAKDIIAYIKSAINPKDKESLSRIINKPKRYISKWMLKDIGRSNKDLFNYIYEHKEFKSWQIKRVEELEGQLILLKIKKPLEAIKYIRKVIGYNDYIKEYCNFRKIGEKGLKEILDELQDGAKSFESLDEWLNHIDEVRDELKANQKSKQDNKNKITLSTMHGAKGLEFNVVWIIGAVEGIIPHEKSSRDDEIEEERRLFYVGITRAKEKLYISSVKTRYEEEVAASRFLEEMEDYSSIEDIKEGMIINHASYGEGKIKSIRGTNVNVKFRGEFTQRKLDLKYCIKNKIITIMKEEEKI